MEKNMEEEENHQESGAANLLTKSSGSLVRIDGLYVDLPSTVYVPDDNGTRKHFSIRGYVSEMRKKDIRMCAPFASDDTNETILEEQLPKLEVPKHRYWQCKRCLLGICTGNPINEEGGVVSELFQIDGGVYEGKASGEDAGLVSAELPENTPELPENTPMEIIAFTKSSVDALPRRSKDKNCASSICTKVAVTDKRAMVLTGSENGSGNTDNQKNDDEPVTKSSQSKEGCKNGACPVAHDPPTSELYVKKKKNTAEHEQAIVLRAEIFTGTDSKAFDSAVSSPAPSVQEEEKNDASTDSGRTSVQGIDQHHLSDDLNGLPRRKMRKVRLLTDLLSGEVNSSVGEGLDVAAEARGLQEDNGKDKQIPPRKKRLSHQENSIVLEIRCMPNVSKKVRSARVNSERAHMTGEVPNSEAGKSQLLKQKHDRPLLQSKKKTPIQVNDDQAGGTIHVGSSPKVGRAETEKCFSVAGGKRPEGENGDASLSPANCSILGVYPTNKKQTELLQSVSSANNFQSENNPSVKLGLDLSLGRPVRVEGTDKDSIIVADPSFIQPNDKSARNPHYKGKDLFGELGASYNSTSSHPVRKLLPWDLNERIAQSTALMQEKQKFSSVFENRGSSAQGKMDFSGRSLKGKNEQVQICLEASKRQHDQGSEKAFEQGSSDDPPMDIVEYMARNQYERNMSGGGQSLTNRRDNRIRECVPFHGNGPLKWLQTESPGITSIRHANAGNCIALPVDNTKASRSVSDFRLSNPERNQLRLFNAFPENQQRQSSSLQFPVCGSSVTGTLPSEGEKSPWLSKSENMPFGLCFPQKYTTLPNNMGSDARSAETLHKGRTISDIKAEEMKIQNKPLAILSNSWRGEPNPEPRGSLDPYSNETVPAMQLLNLMDKGMSSNAAFNADPNRFFGKTFAPCDYHPRLSKDESRSCFDRLSFSHQHQRPGIYNIGETSGHPSPLLFSQMSVRSQEPQESRKWAAPVQVGGGRSPNLFPTTGGLLISQHPYPVKEKRIWGNRMGPVGSSDSLKIPMQYGGLESSTPIVYLQANINSGTAVASKGIVDENICTLNRNPAEFSTPECGNEFTISGSELKVPERVYPVRRNNVAAVGRKRLRPPGYAPKGLFRRPKLK